MPLTEIVLLSIVIPGVAAPQGSKRHVGHGRLVEASKRVKPWRELVSQQVAKALPEGYVPFEGPVELSVIFYLPRPAAAKNRMLPHKGGPGDVDKLARAIGDAITTSGLWKDDAQVTDLTAKKRYASGGTEPRTSIIVRNLDAVARAFV